MKYYEKKAAIDSLFDKLTEKHRQYVDCADRDDILSIKKMLRIEIRSIEKQIKDLKESLNNPLEQD